MSEEQTTYTTQQAMSALGIKSRTAFHHLRRQYPQAFFVVSVGSGRSHQTTYDKAEIDKFIQWRNMYKQYDALVHNVINDPVGFLVKKGKS